jgi:hypothetical protein
MSPPGCQPSSLWRGGACDATVVPERDTLTNNCFHKTVRPPRGAFSGGGWHLNGGYGGNLPPSSLLRLSTGDEFVIGEDRRNEI